MRRRDVLRSCGGVAAAGLLAGCSGNGDGEEPTTTPALEVTSIDPTEGESGKLVVEVRIENGGDAEATGSLYVTVEVSETQEDEVGDDIARRSRDVTVGPGEATVEIETPFDFAAFQGNSSSVDVDIY